MYEYRMCEEAGYKNAVFDEPIEGHQLRVYVTPTDEDNDVIGIFTDAYYYEGEQYNSKGYRLDSKYTGYCVRYWKDMDSSEPTHSCERMHSY